MCQAQNVILFNNLTTYVYCRFVFEIWVLAHNVCDSSAFLFGLIIAKRTFESWLLQALEFFVSPQRSFCLVASSARVT